MTLDRSKPNEKATLGLVDLGISSAYMNLAKLSPILLEFVFWVYPTEGIEKTDWVHRFNGSLIDPVASNTIAVTTVVVGLEHDFTLPVTFSKCANLKWHFGLQKEDNVGKWRQDRRKKWELCDS